MDPPDLREDGCHLGYYSWVFPGTWNDCGYWHRAILPPDDDCQNPVAWCRPSRELLKAFGEHRQRSHLSTLIDEPPEDDDDD